MFVIWLKEMYSKKLPRLQKSKSGPFKLDSDQYGENRERGPSAFGEEFDLLLKSDPD
jgi:hypothetical protein